MSNVARPVPIEHQRFVGGKSPDPSDVTLVLCIACGYHRSPEFIRSACFFAVFEPTSAQFNPSSLPSNPQVVSGPGQELHAVLRAPTLTRQAFVHRMRASKCPAGQFAM
jgi:hypothetical protein